MGSNHIAIKREVSAKTIQYDRPKIYLGTGDAKGPDKITQLKQKLQGDNNWSSG